MGTKPTNEIGDVESSIKKERPTHAVRLIENGESIGTLSIPAWAGKIVKTRVEIVPLDPIIGKVTLRCKSSRKKRK